MVHGYIGVLLLRLALCSHVALGNTERKQVKRDEEEDIAQKKGNSLHGSLVCKQDKLQQDGECE